jgi:hypothetical protein
LWGVAIGLGAVAVVLFITAWSIYLGKRQKEKEEESVVRVSLKDFYGEYLRDEVAADGKYRGATVETSGLACDRPRTDVLGDYRLDLTIPEMQDVAGRGPVALVRASFSVEDGRGLVGVKAGDRVTVRGTCKGLDSVADAGGLRVVRLSRCRRVD